MDCSIIPVQKPVLGQQTRPFWCKYHGLARAFLRQTMLTVSLLDFLNSSGNSNHNVSSSVRHFLLLLFSIALMRDFGWFYDISCPHMHSSPIFFFPADF
jgi:hypothetical protein